MTLSLESLVDQLPKALVENRTQELLTAVLAAERSHQRSVTRRDSPRPAELDSALLARVRFNLEETDPATVADVVRAGGRSPEVRDLEAPWSTRVAAADVDDVAPRPTRKAVRPKKAPAKKAETAAAAPAAPAPQSGSAAQAEPQQAASPASNEGN